MEPIVMGGLFLVISLALLVGGLLFYQKHQHKKQEAARLAASSARSARRQRSPSTSASGTVNDNALARSGLPIVPLPASAQQPELDREARQQAVLDVTEATSNDPVSALRAALNREGNVAFEHARQGQAHQPLILVVDDSKSALLNATRALKGLPYRLVTADNGIAALNRLEQEKPALVITDVDMPQLDGFGLLRRMRNDLRFSDIPVIMVTGHLHLHVKIGANEGVSGFVPKPYDPQNLVGQVTYLLAE